MHSLGSNVSYLGNAITTWHALNTCMLNRGPGNWLAAAIGWLPHTLKPVAIKIWSPRNVNTKYSRWQADELLQIDLVDCRWVSPLHKESRKL